MRTLTSLHLFEALLGWLRRFFRVSDVLLARFERKRTRPTVGSLYSLNSSEPNPRLGPKIDHQDPLLEADEGRSQADCKMKQKDQKGYIVVLFTKWSSDQLVTKVGNLFTKAGNLSTTGQVLMICPM